MQRLNTARRSSSLQNTDLHGDEAKACRVQCVAKKRARRMKPSAKTPATAAATPRSMHAEAEAVKADTIASLRQSRAVLAETTEVAEMTTTELAMQGYLDLPRRRFPPWLLRCCTLLDLGTYFSVLLQRPCYQAKSWRTFIGR